MAESVQIASLQGGELLVPQSGGKVQEVVLALPLSRLLVKIIRVPAENREDPVAYATPLLKAMSPYPDEDLSVSCEILEETESGVVVLAAALPEESAEDVATALDDSGLSVTRIDALTFGLLEDIFAKLPSDERPVRRLVLVGGVDCLSALVLDGRLPVAIRALSAGGDLVREMTLLLLEAEEFAGDAPLGEVLSVAGAAADGLEVLAPVRALEGVGDALEGVAKRSQTPGTVNALPASWRAVLDETRFKRKMGFGFGIAAVVWLLAVAFIVGIPKYYRYKTGRVNDRKAQRQQAEKVRQKKAQVEAVESVSNHDYGALEALRAVVTVLPPSDSSVSLTRWNFKRGEELTFDGTFEEADKDLVWQFNDRLASLKLSAVTGAEEDEEVPYFTQVSMPKGLVKKSFTVKCSFKEEENR